MKIHFSNLLIIFLLIMTSISFSQSQPVPLSQCMDITQPGTYVLTNDILWSTSPTNTCFNIQESAVTLSCDGFTIIGPSNPFGSTPYKAIHVQSRLPGEVLEAVLIENCGINDFDIGIEGNNLREFRVHDTIIGTYSRHNTPMALRTGGIILRDTANSEILNVAMTKRSRDNSIKLNEAGLFMERGNGANVGWVSIEEYFNGMIIRNLVNSYFGSNGNVDVVATRTSGIQYAYYTGMEFNSTLNGPTNNEFMNINIENSDTGVIVAGPLNTPLLNKFYSLSIRAGNRPGYLGLDITGDENEFDGIYITGMPTFTSDGIRIGKRYTINPGANGNVIKNADIFGSFTGIMLLSSRNDLSHISINNAVTGMYLSRSSDNSFNDITITDSNRAYADGFGLYVVGASNGNSFADLRVENIYGTGVWLSNPAQQTTFTNLVSIGNKGGFVFNIEDFTPPSPAIDLTAVINGLSSIVGNNVDIKITGVHLQPGQTRVNRAKILHDKLVFGDVTTGSLVQVTVDTRASGIQDSEIVYVSLLPVASPPNYASFDDKNIKMIKTFPTAAVVIDTVSFHWEDSELAGRVESDLRVMKLDLNTNQWTELPDLPDTASNRITVQNYNVNNEILGLFFR